MKLEGPRAIACRRLAADHTSVVRAVRRRLMIATVLAVLVGCSALAWFVVVPHRRPTLRNDEAYAIDVSNHQGQISWSRVAADGVRFAYVKATEGKTFVDPYFANNWAAASAAGVRVGAYHFFSLCSSGQEQADAFLRTAPPSTTALPPALDLEILSGCTDRPPPAAVQAELDTFVNSVERAWGKKLLIYARSSWTRRYALPGGEGRPRWRTSFFVRPSEAWTVWQVHYFAEVSGVSGRVDLDIVRPLQLVA
jgi:lysozyme